MMLAGERGHSEEERTEEEDLDDSDGEEWLQVPARGGPGAMRVWSAQGAKVPSDFAEDQAGEDETADDEGTGPAAAQIGELGDGFGEDHL